MARFPRASLIVSLALLAAGCAKTPEIALVAPPPVQIAPPPPLPAGGQPGMTIPSRLADGSYATPNRTLTAAGQVWHLRAALNVAALACRGPQEAAIVARYNALLKAQATGLRTAQTALSDEYRAGGGDWQDRYDDAMTRLYNYFSQSFARDGFCAEAATALDQSATVAPADLPAFAETTLARLDRPFTDFYRAYDAWREGQAALARPVIAVTAPAPARSAAVATEPRLELDLSTLQD